MLRVFIAALAAISIVGGSGALAADLLLDDGYDAPYEPEATINPPPVVPPIAAYQLAPPPIVPPTATYQLAPPPVYPVAPPPVYPVAPPPAYRVAPPAYAVAPTVVYPSAPVVVDQYAPPVYGWVIIRPRSCGEFRYWNGERCVDARYNPPHLGPKW